MGGRVIAGKHTSCIHSLWLEAVHDNSRSSSSGSVPFSKNKQICRVCLVEFDQIEGLIELENNDVNITN